MALPTQRRPSGGVAPRLINVALGAWLFLSAFSWHHSRTMQGVTWLAGALCVFFAIAGTVAPTARYLNTALAVLLFVTAWLVPSESAATVWNNVLCAIAIFVISLVPSSTMSLPSHVAPPRRTGT